MNTICSETSLVSASLKGDRQAFGQIVSRYQSSICGIAYAATGDLAQSEDIAQETFITAWRRLSTLREPEKLGSWIRAIARNVIQSYYRKSKREVTAQAEVLDDTAEIPAAIEETPHERIVSEEERQLLWNTLAELPEQYREPLVLFYRQGQSTKAVAEALELPEATVRQRLFRGRELLREQMAAFVEETLGRTNPKQAFTIAVLAALPALAPQAAAAAMAATAAKGSAVLKSASLLGLIGIILGPVLGILGAIIGIRVNLNSAKSPRERSFMIKSIWVFIAYVLGFVSVVIIAGWLVGDRVRNLNNPAWYFGYLGILGALYGASIIFFADWVNRRIHRIRVETGTDYSEPKPMTERSKGHLIGAFAGGIFGSVAWTIAAALIWGPLWSGLIYLAAAISYCFITIRAILKNPARLWIETRGAIAGVAGINMFGICQFWEKSGMDEQMPMFSALLLVLGIALLLVGWSYVVEKRQR